MKRFDRGHLVVLLLVLLAVWPFFSQPALPAHTDAELHVFRLAELARMWGGGAWYPRWAANFYYGYGYPIFNFYAPLSYYLGLLLLLLPRVEPILATKLLFMAALGLAGWGAYFFGRSLFRATSPALIMAACYLFAPYILYIDPHARGVLPESLALGFLPWAMWAVQRQQTFKPSAGTFSFATLSIATILLTHNLMAVVILPALFMWGGALALQRPFSQSRMILWLTPFLLGIGCAAFFWLPMVWEQNSIQISSVIGEGSHYDYRGHFLSLRELLGATRWLDWSSSGLHYQFNFGTAQWGLALVGVVALAKKRSGFGRSSALLALFFTIATTTLMLPLSTPIWQRLFILPYLQFPWRLLGLAALWLAILAGYGWQHWLEKSTWQRWATPLGLLVILLTTLPLTQIAPYPQSLEDSSAITVIKEELAGRWLGTTSTADFVPRTVIVPPAAEPSVYWEIFSEKRPHRVNLATLGTAVVKAEEITPLHTRYHVESADPFTLRLFQFAFPGWVATRNGVELPIIPSEPEGWITLNLPAGKQIVEVRFGSTVPRQLSWVITVISLGTLGVMVLWLRGKNGGYSADLPEIPLSTSWQPLIIMAMFTLLHITLIQPRGWLHWQSTAGQARPARTSVNVHYGDELRLIGYTAPLNLPLGRAIDLTLYWQANRPMTTNYQTFVHLLKVDEGIELMAESGKLNPGDFPTEQWPLDKYVRDQYQIAMPANLPPGHYHLTAGIWQSATGQRLLVQKPAGEWFVLAQFEVK